MVTQKISGIVENRTRIAGAGDDLLVDISFTWSPSFAVKQIYEKWGITKTVFSP